MKETILRKRLVSEGIPEKWGWYMTNNGPMEFIPKDAYGGDVWFDMDANAKRPKFYFKEETAHVLSDDELNKEICDFAEWLSKMYYDSIGISGQWRDDQGNINTTQDLYDEYLATKQDEPIR